MSRNVNTRESIMRSKKKIPGKRVIILPTNFQEVLILQEIEISKNVNVDVIRKLLGMEYYDSVNRPELQMFYTSKLNSFLTQPNVVEILDKNPINLKETSQLNLNLFGSNQETTSTSSKTVPRKLSNHDLKTTVDESSLPSRMKRNRTVADVRKRKNEEKEIETYIKEELNNLNRKLNKMNEAICEDIIEQKSKFEEMKRKKKQNQRNGMKSLMKRVSINSIPSQEMISSGKSSEKSMQVQVAVESQNVTNIPLDAEPPRRDSMAKRRRESVIQTGMLKEIEEFVEKNMSEMYKALDELKLSFEDEIISTEKNGYPDIADSLREDMKVELETLKEQFEEQRLVETEKIRAKYQQSRGSFHS